MTMAAMGIILLISTVLLAASYTVQTRMASINVANNISFGAKTDLMGGECAEKVQNGPREYKLCRTMCIFLAVKNIAIRCRNPWWNRIYSSLQGRFR
jgi:hypothetical protein